MPPSFPVIIIGAGLSGLCCARTLHRAGIAFELIDSSDAVGGRVRTDQVNGFLLDRGFQVYLTAYPEGKRQFNYEKLNLKAFEPGAGVFFDGRIQTVMDPWRRPGALLDSALAKVGTLADKLRVGAMRSRVQRGAVEDRYNRPETTIAEYLHANGFSQAMIDRFFRPFFGGIFFDLDLRTSSRAMEFVFRCFSQGDAAVPAAGMQQLPEQIAADLPAGSIHLHTRADAIDSSPGNIHVQTTDVRTNQPLTLRASAIVNAAPGCVYLPQAQGIAGQHDRSWKSVTNIYFAGSGTPPVKGPLLLLDGERTGPASNVMFMSSASNQYAPAGQFLISCALIGLPDNIRGQTAEQASSEQLGRWFGPGFAAGLRHLRTYRIEKALPDQTAPCYLRRDWPVFISPGVYACGDTHDTGSIDGALKSGRLAAEAIIADRIHHSSHT